MTGPNTGRRGSRWRKLVRTIRNRRGDCALCGQPIDYSITDPYDPGAFTVDHKLSWIGYPELREDLGNLQAAHRRCNLAKGSGPSDPYAGGMQSEQW